MSELAYLERILGWMADDLIGGNEVFWRRRDGTLRASLNMNDMFYWACSDAEDIEPEDLDRLEELLREADDRDTAAHLALPPHEQSEARGKALAAMRADALDGAMQFACEKRQQRPQKPWFTPRHSGSTLQQRLLRYPDGNEYFEARKYLCPVCEKPCVPVTKWQIEQAGRRAVAGEGEAALAPFEFIIDYPAEAYADYVPFAEEYGSKEWPEGKVTGPFLGVELWIVVDPKLHPPCAGGKPVLKEDGDD